MGAGGAHQGDGLKRSCGKWETLIKKRVISESNNAAVFGAAVTLSAVDGQMSHVCRSKMLSRTG